jgi:hypothetical protein
VEAARKFKAWGRSRPPSDPTGPIVVAASTPRISGRRRVRVYGEVRGANC